MGRLNWLAVSTHCPCNNKFGREINSLGIGVGVAVGVCVCVCVLFWGGRGEGVLCIPINGSKLLPPSQPCRFN